MECAQLRKLIISIVAIFFVCLFCGVVFGQQEILRIRGFGGLNTIDGDFQMKPNEARVAHNIDWSRNIGAISKRRGWDTVTTLAGQDSLVGIYGAFFSDGTQRLIVVSDSFGVGYGNIYTTEKGSNQFGEIYTWCDRITAVNDFTYLDTFILNDGATPDTVVVSFTADGNATVAEVIVGIQAAVLAKSELTGKIDASGFTQCNPFNGDEVYFVEILESTDISLFVNGNQVLTQDSTDQSRITTNFSIVNKPSFAMFNDIVYIVNGDNGIAWDGSHVAQFPMIAPGMPVILPITQTGGELNGEYRYTFRATTTISGLGESVISKKIRVTNGRVLMKNFSWISGDSVKATPDTMHLKLYRTKANPGPLRNNVYAFWTGDTLSIVDGEKSTFTHTDVISDGNLTTDSVLLPTGAVSMLTPGGSAYTRRYGAIGIISTVLVSAGDSGVIHGIPSTTIEDPNFLGWGWWQTYLDTVIVLEGDTSRGFFVLDSANIHSTFTLSLVTPPDSVTGVVINIYRAPVYATSFDSLFLFNNTFFNPNISLPDTWWIFADSTRIGELQLVAQVSASDTSYVDTMSWTTLKVAQPLRLSSDPRRDRIFTYQGRMFGVSGSNLSFSRLDSAGYWGALDFISLRKNDGDEITVAYPARRSIKVKKNKSSFNVYQDANLQWNRREISSHIGAVAARSYAPGALGHYYLSEQGVIRESEGQFLERTQTTELISKKLDNFIKMPVKTRAKAEAFYHDQKYHISIGDTDYVYDERADKWSTWSMPFGGATSFGTEDNVEFLPGDTMYFFTPGDSTIKKFPSGEDDGGGVVTISWQSAPILPDQFNYSIDAIGVWGSGSGSDSLTIALKDENGNFLNPILGLNASIKYPLNERYRIKSLDPQLQLYYFLVAGSGSVLSNSASIDGFDIYYTNKGITKGK